MSDNDLNDARRMALNYVFQDPYDQGELLREDYQDQQSSGFLYNNNNHNENDENLRFSAETTSESTVRRQQDEALQSGRDFAVQLALAGGDGRSTTAGSAMQEDDNDNIDDYRIYTTMRTERLQEKLAIQDSAEMLPSQSKLPPQGRRPQQETLFFASPSSRPNNARYSEERTSAASLQPPRSRATSKDGRARGVGRETSVASNQTYPGATATNNNHRPRLPTSGADAPIGAVWVNGINTSNPSIHIQEQYPVGPGYPQGASTRRKRISGTQNTDDVSTCTAATPDIECPSSSGHTPFNRGVSAPAALNHHREFHLPGRCADPSRQDTAATLSTTSGRTTQGMSSSTTTSHPPAPIQEEEESGKANNKFLSLKTISILVCFLVLITAVAVTVPLLLVNSQPEPEPLSNTDTAGAAESTYILTDKYPIDTIHAHVPATICREDIPGRGRSELCLRELTLSRGGGACNLVAQGFLQQHDDEADIAMLTAGSCRSDVVMGDFTTQQAMALLPNTDESLYLVELSGTQIWLILRRALQAVFGSDVGAVGDFYPYAAGLRYNVTASVDFLDRVDNIEVLTNKATTTQEEEEIWAPVESDRLYKVVVSQVLAEEFQVVPSRDYHDLGTRTTETFIEYAISQSILLDPPASDYSTQLFLT